jgi:hypothetical protein
MVWAAVSGAMIWLPTSASSLSLLGALPLCGSTRRLRQDVRLRSLASSLQGGGGGGKRRQHELNQDAQP